MAGLSIRDVHKSFGNVEVLKGIDLEVDDGQFLILVGGSGCGKSTLLNMIAGLESVTSGEIRINDQLVNDLPPKSRDIAMVFQSYALYPSMTVRENISFGLKVRKVPASEQRVIVDKVADLLQIGPLLDRKPSRLSGGQRQRVAMGRALARDPALFLFDEPLSNLDAQLRLDMRSEIKLMHRRLGKTICYVTHDQIEAMTMGDRIAVMKDGVVQQFGTPQQIYDSPANQYVASFIGAPPMNFVEARLAAVGSGVGIECETTSGRTVLNLPYRAGALRARPGDTVILGLRPERITDERNAHSESGAALQRLAMRVEVVEPTGPDTLVVTLLNGKRLISRVHPAASPVPGTDIGLMFDVSKAVLFDPKTGERIDTSAAASPSLAAA